MDMISNLPDEIILHIVSFLSAKEAALALVLSKGWQNLYTIIPNLEFNDRFENQGSLTDVLDGVLAMPASSRIKKISLKCFKKGTINPVHYSEVNHRLSNLLKRGVMELEIHIRVDHRYSLPFEVFTCKTLVELKLGFFLEISHLPENALLPALKTLILDTLSFYDDDCGNCVFKKLVSACPVLVELMMRSVELLDCEPSPTVSIPTLERLTIYRRCDGFDHQLESYTFDTPNLTYLAYNVSIMDSYPVVNFKSYFEGKLDLVYTINIICDYDPRFMCHTNLIERLRDVEILNISSAGTMEVLYIFRKTIPVFENMHHLSITTDQDFCWEALPYLLRKSPNLKTLVIQGYLHVSNVYGQFEDLKSEDDEPVCKCLSGYSFLSSCPVKVLEITKYNGTKQELEQMKHFLEKLSFLELVKIRARAKDDKELNIKNLLNLLPRSSKCQIQVYSS